MDDKQLFRQDARVIGLVGLAHGTSHFYHLILAALIPWLKPEFNLSYGELGLLMTVFFAVSGVGQAMAGFVVDRVGARSVLFAGLALLGTAALMLSFAPSYAVLLAGSMLAGVGNSVFHPADYTLLNQRVSKERMAHAFSVHGITGNLGWAASPVFLAGIAALAGWRVALLCAALLPFSVLALLYVQRDALRSDPIPTPTPDSTPALTPKAGQAGRAAHAQDSSFGFLKLPAVWMSFGFFFLIAVALGGIQAFSSVTLVSLYGISLASAMTAYTAYMLASAGGMVIGGFLAARTAHHDRTIAMAFTFSALMALLLGMAVVPGWMVIIVMGAIGLGAGVAGPSRDLLIRAAAPKGATGRVFGVVYSGLDTGLATGPLLFGAMLDRGHPGWVFAGIALFQVLAIGTAVGVGDRSRTLALQKA